MLNFKMSQLTIWTDLPEMCKSLAFYDLLHKNSKVLFGNKSTYY